MKLNIKYSTEFEVNRVFNTLKKIDWYKSNNYNPKLPEFLGLLNLQNITKEQIENSILQEYHEDDYLEAKKYIEENFEKIIKDESFEQNILQTDLVLQNEYEIFLTKYGVGGSYNLPNKIILNIKCFYSFGLIKTMTHEIIHLLIEQFIRENKIDHWTKERLVDLLLDQFALDLNKFQNLPIDTYKIDQIFEKNYPDVEKIIQNLEKEK
jgi:hypothetical protein